MTRNEVIKSVKQSILIGKTKQETFEELKMVSNLSQEKLAKIIKGIPTLKAKASYQSANIVLIVLISLTIFFKIIWGIVTVFEDGIKWFPLVIISPIINVILLIGVSKYKTESYVFVAVLAILGLFQYIITIISQTFNPLSLIDLAISVTLIILGFYVYFKLQSDFQVHKQRYQNSQGQYRYRDVIKFYD